MASQATDFKILMFPWLAHGHIFPYLELSKRILMHSKRFHIYVCSTAINFSSIQDFIKSNGLDESIEVLEIQLQPSDELPPHYHTTKNLPSHLIRKLLKAFQTAKSSFSDIITSLRPDLVIYDGFQPWASKIASSQRIPTVYFSVVGVTTSSFTHHLYSSWDDNFPFHELHLQSDEKMGLDNFVEFLSANVFEYDKNTLSLNYILSSDVILVKTSRGLEGKYLDYFSSIMHKKIIPVGPLVTDPSDDENSEILRWLSRKEHHSTVYISFGSEYLLSKDEMHEIAKGLDLCTQVNFIWVIRFPFGDDKNSIDRLKEAAPTGFLERVEERGKIVSGWAPQAKILSHPSTCAFISHCGWSSVMESLFFGVPIIGMPMKLNMFIDARMLVSEGVCMEIPRQENEGYKGEEIAKVIKKVISEKSGEGLRHKAVELSKRMKMEEGDAIDETAEKLWQLCLINKHSDVVN